MTKVEVLENFRALFVVVIGDSIQNRENWNDYTDALREENQITLFQYENWTNPY
jgi:hypothetical protein